MTLFLTEIGSVKIEPELCSSVFIGKSSLSTAKMSIQSTNEKIFNEINKAYGLKSITIDSFEQSGDTIKMKIKFTIYGQDNFYLNLQV